MNINKNFLAFVITLSLGFQVHSVPRPDAVEPAWDEDDNPTYVIKYGKEIE